MKFERSHIYWSSNSKSNPPQNAVFSLQPFSPKDPIAILQNPIRLYDLPKPISRIKVKKQTFLPTKPEWIHSIEQTLIAIQNDHFSKVVLARCCILECEKAPDPFAIAAALEQKSQNATVFCFAKGNTAFLGASPERLFSRIGQTIESDALAGTIKRGKTPEEDLSLQNALLQDEKMIREFTFVKSFITEKLSPLCLSPLSLTPISVRKTQNVQHLHAQISGTLREHISDTDLLNALHPTPALCGSPKEKALDWISHHESFSRGLYGGTVGWSSQNAAEQIVAIRSCLIVGSTVYLYTGTGIVAGSNPEKEWEELNVKMELYKGIFL